MRRRTLAGAMCVAVAAAVASPVGAQRSPPPLPAAGQVVDSAALAATLAGFVAASPDRAGEFTRLWLAWDSAGELERSRVLESELGDDDADALRRLVLQHLLAAPDSVSSLRLEVTLDEPLDLRTARTAFRAPRITNVDEVRRLMERAPRAGVSGRVVLWILVEPDGVPSRTRIVESSGDPTLDTFAASVAMRARFDPAVREGEPQAAWSSLPLTFRAK